MPPRQRGGDPATTHRYARQDPARQVNPSADGAEHQPTRPTPEQITDRRGVRRSPRPAHRRRGHGDQHRQQALVQEVALAPFLVEGAGALGRPPLSGTIDVHVADGGHDTRDGGYREQEAEAVLHRNAVTKRLPAHQLHQEERHREQCHQWRNECQPVEEQVPEIRRAERPRVGGKDAELGREIAAVTAKVPDWARFRNQRPGGASP